VPILKDGFRTPYSELDARDEAEHRAVTDRS